LINFSITQYAAVAMEGFKGTTREGTGAVREIKGLQCSVVQAFLFCDMPVQDRVDKTVWQRHKNDTEPAKKQ